MCQEKLLSVIVPVYNVERYLARCIDSILQQSYRNLELILVDDGASDSSGAICDEYAQKDPRVNVIHKENGGLSSARNAGLDAAKGEFISFVDSDDWITWCVCCDDLLDGEAAGFSDLRWPIRRGRGNRR